MDESPAEIPAVSLALRDADRLLLVRRARRPLSGQWAFPGGRIEPGETAEQAARRELAEETGLLAGPIASFREIIIRGVQEGVPYRYRLTVFCGAGSGAPIPGDDADDAGWFTLAQMAALPVTDSTLEIARELLGERKR